MRVPKGIINLNTQIMVYRDAEARYDCVDAFGTYSPCVYMVLFSIATKCHVNKINKIKTL